MTTPTRWRIVPAESTADMLTHPALDDQISDNHGDRDVRKTAQLHWEAMLAAAPAPGDEVVDSIIEAVMRANDTPSQRRAVLAALAGET